MPDFRDSFPMLGYGVGLRTEYYEHVLETAPRADWLEVVSENFMVRGGRPLTILEEVCDRYPVVLHGVSLSIGSADPLNLQYLSELRSLIERTNPAWVSDHLCWTGVDGRNLHDLLPLPFTREVLTHVVDRVRQVQDLLGRPILLENVSSYLTFQDSEMPEWEFLAAVAETANCGILLDINNIFVSAYNHGFSADAYLSGVPAGRVVQFHLAGHSERDGYLLDTHDHAVRPEVWALYQRAVDRFGAVTTLIERDDKFPPFEEVLAEADQARNLARSLVPLTQQENSSPAARTNLAAVE